MSMRKINMTAITPTGDRPEAFALCEKWMAKQTCVPMQWIIIDDGEVPQEIKSPFVTQYIRRERQQDDPSHTLPVQILKALDGIQQDNILFFEDDEYYTSDFIETMATGLFGHDIAGQEDSFYYRLPEKMYHRCFNMDRASLCVTAMSVKHLDVLRKCCEKCIENGTPYIDMLLWQHFRHGKGKTNLTGHQVHIGIKGVPGRKGTTMGWKTHQKGGWNLDSDLSVLRDRLESEEDFNEYKSLMERHNLWPRE